MRPNESDTTDSGSNHTWDKMKKNGPMESPAAHDADALARGSARKLRLLIIGPLPPHFGGAAGWMGTLIDELAKRPDVELRLVDTVRPPSPLGQLRRTMRVVVGFMRAMRHVDAVSVHLSDPAVGGLVYALTRMARLPLLVHRFGGVEPLAYWKGPRAAIERKLLESAEMNLLETQLQIDSVKHLATRDLRQYPNNRPMGEGIDLSGRPAACTRFIYLGHVKPDKGIRELIEAAERLPEGVSVDVFGELCEGITEADFAGRKRIRHGGILPRSEVATALTDHDALVMPTHFEREGHPGVVIEAYQAGLPVVATEWLAIPEVVDDTSGILVPPYDVDALAEAMTRLHEDADLFVKLREGAVRRGREFSTEVWADRFVDFCREIARQRPSSPAD